MALGATARPARQIEARPPPGPAGKFSAPRGHLISGIGQLVQRHPRTFQVLILLWGVSIMCAADDEIAFSLSLLSSCGLR